MRTRAINRDATDRTNDRDATEVDVMRPTRIRHTPLKFDVGRPPSKRVAQGFTLVELLVVLIIIGILLAFIMRAAWEGLRRGEERGTQALIAKLETGITDRLDALTNEQPYPNAAHNYLASSNTINLPPRSNSPRAAVIAQFDRLKSEFPDVFYIQNDSNYPFNFAAFPYPGPTPGLDADFNMQTDYFRFLLPLGTGVKNDPPNYALGGNTLTPIDGVNVIAVFPQSTGIFGASYSVRGGFAKQLGSGPQGYDGQDNNGDGLIDELNEWGAVADLQTKLANHTHKTARAETLYAVLVEGVGPLGSVFNPDDFNDSEVADTDNDGLLEFVDAWGEPLQFFRWPIYYHGTGTVDPNNYGNYAPSTQRGYLPYSIPPSDPNSDREQQTTPLLTREQNPLDPNQLLVQLDWWSSRYNNSDTKTFPYSVFDPSGKLSGGAVGFTQFFMPLSDPWVNVPETETDPLKKRVYWNRNTSDSTFFEPREFYSRFLLLSGGADKTPGVALVSNDYFSKLDDIGSQESFYVGPIKSPYALPFEPGAANYVPLQPAEYEAIKFATKFALWENQAGSVTPIRSDNLYQTPASLLTTNHTDDITASIQLAGSDDITNHSIQAPAGGSQ